MARIFNSFSLQTTLPIDERIVVGDEQRFATRNALLASGNVYEGLIVYDKTDSMTYVWEGGDGAATDTSPSSWTVVGSGAGPTDSTGRAIVVTGAGTGSDGPPSFPGPTDGTGPIQLDAGNYYILDSVEIAETFTVTPQIVNSSTNNINGNKVLVFNARWPHNGGFREIQPNNIPAAYGNVSVSGDFSPGQETDILVILGGVGPTDTIPTTTDSWDLTIEYNPAYDVALPANPTRGQQVAIKRIGNTHPRFAGATINGTDNTVLNIADNETVVLVYTNETEGWVDSRNEVIRFVDGSDDNPVLPRGAVHQVGDLIWFSRTSNTPPNFQTQHPTIGVGVNRWNGSSFTPTGPQWITDDTADNDVYPDFIQSGSGTRSAELNNLEVLLVDDDGTPGVELFSPTSALDGFVLNDSDQEPTQGQVLQYVGSEDDLELVEWTDQTGGGSSNVRVLEDLEDVGELVVGGIQIEISTLLSRGNYNFVLFDSIVQVPLTGLVAADITAANQINVERAAGNAPIFALIEGTNAAEPVYFDIDSITNIDADAGIATLNVILVGAPNRLVNAANPLTIMGNTIDTRDDADRDWSTHVTTLDTLNPFNGSHLEYQNGRWGTGTNPFHGDTIQGAPSAGNILVVNSVAGDSVDFRYSDRVPGPSGTVIDEDPLLRNLIRQNGFFLGRPEIDYGNPNQGEVIPDVRLTFFTARQTQRVTVTTTLDISGNTLNELPTITDISDAPEGQTTPTVEQLVVSNVLVEDSNTVSFDVTLNRAQGGYVGDVSVRVAFATADDGDNLGFVLQYGPTPAVQQSSTFATRTTATNPTFDFAGFTESLTANDIFYWDGIEGVNGFYRYTGVFPDTGSFRNIEDLPRSYVLFDSLDIYWGILAFEQHPSFWVFRENNNAGESDPRWYREELIADVFAIDDSTTSFSDYNIIPYN